MKYRRFGTFAAAVACMGMVLPPSAYSAAPGAAVNDVALRPGGVLVGQVVDQQGVVRAGTTVAIYQGEHEVVRTVTDEHGVFAAQGLRGGQYELVTQEGGSVCRLWAADTAPPASRQSALIVSGDQVVRGQRGYGPMNSWVAWMKAHPYLTAGTVAAAIAIPLAFIDDDDDNGS